MLIEGATRCLPCNVTIPGMSHYACSTLSTFVSLTSLRFHDFGLLTSVADTPLPESGLQERLTMHTSARLWHQVILQNVLCPIE